MQLSSEETLTLQLRRRSFQLALADLRVQGALIVTTAWFAVCPCCGYPTLTQRHNYDFCPLCDWFDEGQDDRAADAVGHGIDDDSLAQARRNFIDGHTRYRAEDKRYAAAMQTAAERERLIAAYDALLPDVHSWSFVGALHEIDALYQALRERELGPRKAQMYRDARWDKGRRADYEWEVWSSIAFGTLPQRGWRPPSIEDHEQRRVQSIATRATDLVEERLGALAPIVVHRGRNYWCWTIGDREAWLIGNPDATIRLMHPEPSMEGRLEPIFSIHDELAPDKIAQDLAEFFGSPRESPT